jgi:hypothetical protein
MQDLVYNDSLCAIEDLDIDVLPGGVAAATAGPICVIVIIAVICNPNLW